MSNGLLKSAVTPEECPMLSASASARKSRAEPDAFGHVRVRFLTGRLCLGRNALVTGQKIALTGGKRGFPGTVW